MDGFGLWGKTEIKFFFTQTVTQLYIFGPLHSHVKAPDLQKRLSRDRDIAGIKMLPARLYSPFLDIVIEAG